MRWTGSPRDVHQSTCLKKSLSNTLDGRHVTERGSMDLHRTAAILFAIGSIMRSSDRHQTAATFRDRGHYAIIRFFIGRPRSFTTLATHVEPSRSVDCHRTVQTDRARTPQSRSDRTAIAARLITCIYNLNSYLN